MLLKDPQWVDIFLSILAFLEKSLLILCSRMGEIVCDGQRKETKFIHKSAKTKQCQRSILKGFTRSLHYYKTAKESV